MRQPTCPEGGRPGKVPGGFLFLLRCCLPLFCFFSTHKAPLHAAEVGEPLLASIEFLSTSHENGSTHSANLPLTVVVDTGGLDLATATVRLRLDAIDISDTVTVVPLGGSRSDRVRIEAPLNLRTNTLHSYRLSIEHTNASPSLAVLEASFATDFRDANDFIIELEDFDYDGGQFVAAANERGYRGLGYAGLGAVTNVDYFIDISPDEEPDHYRNGEVLNVPLAKTPGDLERNGYVMSSNYRITWGGGDWFHYTREVPLGRYRIYAAMSFGGGGTNQVEARLSMVRGMGWRYKFPGLLGQFRGGPTAGWGVNAFFPLLDPQSGEAVTVVLDGRITFRFDLDRGDADYLILVPDPEAEVTSSWMDGDRIRYSWKLTPGTWTLQSATSPFLDFQDVGPATNNPFTFFVPATNAARYFRLNTATRPQTGSE